MYVFGSDYLCVGEQLSFRNLQDLITSKKAYELKIIRSKLEQRGYVLVETIKPRQHSSALTENETDFGKRRYKSPTIFLCLQEGTSTFKAIKVIPNKQAKKKKKTEEAKQRVDFYRMIHNEKPSVVEAKAELTKFFTELVETQTLQDSKATTPSITYDELLKDIALLKATQAKIIGKNTSSTLTCLISVLESQAKALAQDETDSENVRIMRLLNRASKEAEVLKRLFDFPFICNLKDHFEDDHFLYMVFPYFPGGTLHDLLLVWFCYTWCPFGKQFCCRNMGERLMNHLQSSWLQSCSWRLSFCRKTTLFIGISSQRIS